MVIINPNPLYPGTGDPMPNPYYPNIPFIPPFEYDYPNTWAIKEIEKKWKERHVKDVKRGILITFDDNEDPIFIATDDACFEKILKAIKDERSTDNKRD